MSELLALIDKGEGEQLDFKFSIEDQKKIARTLTAFANKSGGSLLIGVKNNGKIKGVNPEEEYFMIEGAAGMYCQPEVSFKSKIWEEGHHLVLEIIVPKSSVKHKSMDDDGKWRHYVRIDDHTFKANKILRKIWVMENKSDQDKPTQFDDQTLALLKLIGSREKVTLSQIYKYSELEMTDVDNLIAKLVYWRVIEMAITEKGTFYRVFSE